MTTTTQRSNSRASWRTLRPTVTLAALLLALDATPSYAGSATWNLNPSNDNWNNAANWTPATVPNGAGDTATFAHTRLRQAELSVNTEVISIVFNLGDPTFIVIVGNAVSLTLSGAGVINNSGFIREFSCGFDGTLNFTNSATAGSQTTFSNGGSFGTGQPGLTQFSDTTNANGATFTNAHPPGLASSEVP